MTTPPTKLRSQLEEAKRQLKDSIHARDVALPPPVEARVLNEERPARSKLNTLLGKTSVPQRPLSLFQTVGAPQRPTYDLIADRILGPEVGAPPSFLDAPSGYAHHVAARLRHLQQRLEAAESPPPSSESNDVYVGVEEDGTPVWSQVLREQRGEVRSALEADLAPPTEGDAFHATRILDLSSSWPQRLGWSTVLTFKHWFTAEENLRATQHCEQVIDRPAHFLNPLLVVAEPQSGCSHLLHATGQALLRRQEGHVLFITAADVNGVDGLEASWQNALPGATALVIDDVHEFAQHETWGHQLGVLVDHALNHGLQVLAGGRIGADAFPPSRLKEVFRSSLEVRLTSPQPPSLMAFARWRCAQRNLLVSDRHLAQLSRMEPRSWRAVETRLEQLVLAFENGAVLLDHDDVYPLLLGGKSVAAVEEHERVEDLASRLVGDALDSVYSSLEAGGIDLHSPLEPWVEDDYEPPGWDATSIGEDSHQLEQRLRESVDPIQPGRPSVLDVNEREKYIVRANDPLERSDVNRTVEVLVDIDDAIDRRMNVSTDESVSASLELHRLEEQMVVLAQRALEADIEELITIADELRTLEERLVELDPEREPLPPFEDDVPTKRERKAVRRRKGGATKHVDENLESFEPEGEWNIDGTGISAEDLLDETPEKNVVHLARLRPRKVLMGEEE